MEPYTLLEAARTLLIWDGPRKWMLLRKESGTTMRMVGTTRKVLLASKRELIVTRRILGASKRTTSVFSRV